MEVGYLKKTLAVIFVILTTFCAALLAVVSVMLDTPEGVIVGMDEWKAGYCKSYGGEAFGITLPNCSFEQAKCYKADGYYASVDGVSFNTELSTNGNSFRTDVTTMLGDVTYVVERHGYVLQSDSVQLLNRVCGEIAIEFDNGIFLSKDVANELDVQVGDAVTLGAKTYPIVAIYKRNNLVKGYSNEDVVLPTAYFFVVTSQQNALTVHEMHLAYASSGDIYSMMKKLNRQGVDYEMHRVMQEMLGNIELIESFYGSVAALLAALVMFIMYTLFALFFRERRAQICRLKLLGATDGTVASVYCIVALALVLVAVVVATALSVVLSRYFLGLCEQMFGNVYPYHFRVWTSFALFATLIMVGVSLFAVMQRQISRASVVEVVRHE